MLESRSEEEIEFLTNIRDLDELVSNGLSYEDKLTFLTTGPNKYRLTKGLFWEFSHDYPARRDYALFTLQDTGSSYFLIKEGIPRYNMKKLYDLCNDHTEHTFITKFMWDERHWDKVVNAPLISPHIDNWRKDLRLKIKSSMYDVLLQDALDESSKTKTSSARYLLEKYLDPKTGKKQTSKQKLQDKEELLNKQNLLVLDEDYDRVTKGNLN